LPYIAGVTDDGSANRAAEAENFDQIAKEKYEKKYPDKNYEKLSYEYRRKLRYGAMKEYTATTGKPAYEQLPGNTTFDEYLKGRSDEFQREWLGATRYKMYKENKLSLEHMVDSDKGFKRTVEGLRTTYNIDISPAEMTTKQFFEFSEKNAENYTTAEQEVSRWYSEPDNASAANGLLRGKPLDWEKNETLKKLLKGDKTKDEIEKEIWGNIKTLDTAIPKCSLPENTILFRGCREIRWLFDGEIPKVGKEKKWESFTSASIERPISDRYSAYTKDSVVVELHAPKGTTGIPLGTPKLSNVHNQDKEFLLGQNTWVKVKSVEKKTNGWYVIAEIIG